MDFEKFLSQNKAPILKRWFHLISETYPPETAHLLKKEKNQFANPVGHSISDGIAGIYDELSQDLDPDKITPHLDRVIRIRAIQDFSPAQAVAFIFGLKTIVREQMENSGDFEGQALSDTLSKFDRRVDETALLAFNIYSECREKLAEIRINEVKNRSYRLLQKADLLAEIPEWKPKVERGKQSKKPKTS